MRKRVNGRGTEEGGGKGEGVKERVELGRGRRGGGEGAMVKGRKDRGFECTLALVWRRNVGPL